MAYLASLIILATQAFVTILPNPVAVPAPFPGGKHFKRILCFSLIISGLAGSFLSNQTEFCVTVLFISDYRIFLLNFLFW